MSSNGFRADALAYFQSHAIDPQVATDAGVSQRAGSILYPYRTPEGEVFFRERPLAGCKSFQPRGIPLQLWWARGRPGEPQGVLVCEGEPDALAAISHLPHDGDVGDLGVVAVPGTGFPRARLVQALVGGGVLEAFLVFDADEAGRKYRDEVFRALAEAGITPIPIELPDGQDLADCLAGASDPTGWLTTTLAAHRFASEQEEQRPDDSAPEQREGRHVALTSTNMIRSERVRWMWTGRIPLRGLTVVPGEKGLGKSILTNAWVAAKLTRGELEGELEGQPVDVLIATAEDDWASVIKPRLMAHGADLDRVHRIEVYDETGHESLLTLPDDVHLLEDEIQKLRAAGRTVGMIVVDPIGAFMADKTDSHKDAPVRRALAPLAALSERLDLAAVVVAHLTKDDSKKVMLRVSGAGAFVNAARSVLAFARDPGDPDGEQGRERVLVHVATNWGRYAPSLGARVESRLVDVDDGSQADVGYLVVTGETDVGADDLQRGAHEDGSDCEELIGAALSDAPRPSVEVKEEVSARLGVSRKTVERHAVRMADRGELDIESGGFPRTTTWTLISKDSDRSGSEDSGDGAVGTSLDAGNVPTRDFGPTSGLASPGGDSEDTAASPPQDVATGVLKFRPVCRCKVPDVGDDGRCSRCYGQFGERAA